MGFDVGSTVAVLQIDQGTYKGVEARVAGMNAGQLADMTALAGTVDFDGNGTPTLRPEDAHVLGDLFAMLAGALESWNLERDGQPIPCDENGVRSLDFPLVLELVDLWMTAGGGVDVPLGDRSTNGGPPPELSLPMEPLSPNPQPSPEPT